MDKMIFRLCAIALIGVMVFMGGYVLAQDKAEQKNKDLLDLYLKVTVSRSEARLFAVAPDQHPEMRSATSDITKAYSLGVSKREFVEAMVTSALSDYCSGNSEAKSAAQLSNVHEKASVDLSLVQTTQNERIIELLEQIASAKK
jgi:hypothetical protein